MSLWIQYSQPKIEALESSQVERSSGMLSIKHMLFTMIDTKMCNAVSHTTSNEFLYLWYHILSSYLTKMRNPKRNCFNFGLSILHARLRSFESLLHLSFNYQRIWQERSEADNSIIKKQKDVQKMFKSERG